MVGSLFEVKVVAFICDLVIVLVVLLLKQALVAVGVVGGAWRSAHVVSVAFVGCGSSLQLVFGIGVEAPEGQDDDLVVEQGSEDEQDEAEDGLPVERLQAEQAAHDPDDQGARRVDSGALGG